MKVATLAEALPQWPRVAQYALEKPTPAPVDAAVTRRNGWVTEAEVYLAHWAPEGIAALHRILVATLLRNGRRLPRGVTS